MTQITPLIFGLVLLVSSVPTARAQQPPAKPRIKVEFRWAEFRPLPGVTEEKGIPWSCGDSLIYPHKKTILDNQDIADARLGGSLVVGPEQNVTLYDVKFHLTDAGKRKLVKAGQPGTKKVLVLFLDGRDSGAAYWVDVADLTQFVPWTGYCDRAAAEALIKGIR